MNDAIKRALEIATVEACNAVDGCPRNGLCHDAGQCLYAPAMEYTAAAIAAFLDALPLYSDMPMGKDRMGFFDAATRAHWAAVVRRAAGGE